jgi:hypothetical protein
VIQVKNCRRLLYYLSCVFYNEYLFFIWITALLDSA